MATAGTIRTAKATAMNGRAGDVPAAAHIERKAIMPRNDQTPDTSAPLIAKRGKGKYAERRKLRNKARRAKKKTNRHWAKLGVPKDKRDWLDF